VHFHIGTRHVILVQSRRSPIVLQVPRQLENLPFAGKRLGLNAWSAPWQRPRGLVQRLGVDPWSMALPVVRTLSRRRPDLRSLAARSALGWIRPKPDLMSLAAQSALGRIRPKRDLMSLAGQSALGWIRPKPDLSRTIRNSAREWAGRLPSGGKRRERPTIEFEGPEIEIKGFDPRALGAGVSWLRLLAAAVVGGLAVYLLDPQHGNRRRKMAADRTAAMLRRSVRRGRRFSRYLGSRLYALPQPMLHARRGPSEPMDDVTLARKVESLLFRDPHIPKGNININAEHGTVVLRGEVEHPEDIREIERRVRNIDDVQEVRSLLHLVHTRPL